MRLQTTCYRAHDPRWSFAPTSGEGARLKGGRFNPIGTPALYLATTIPGCVLEMQHGFAYRLEPMTICSYDLDVDDVIDLGTEDGRQDMGVTLDELSCPWAEIVSNGGTPPSWTLATRLINGGTAGIIVPSFAVGATADHSNVVLWRWGPDLPHKVDVFDPSGKLPRNMLSWT